LLQEVRTKGLWEEWILFMLDAIESTAVETLKLIKKINSLVEQTAEDILTALPKIYSRELVALLFFEFYTKTIYIEKGLRISRKTAVTYLSALEESGFLTSERIGRERIYLNKRLFEVVRQAGK